MKKTNFIVCIFFLLLYSYSGNAQAEQGSMKAVAAMVKSQIDNGESFLEYEVFNIENTRKADEEIDKTVEKYTLLSLNVDDLKQVIDHKENTIRLNIPNTHGKSYDLALVKADIFAPGFTVKTSDASSELATTGVHYRGIISDDYNSLVALSFFEDEVMGFISKDDTQLVLGKLKGNSTNHILYQENNLKISPDFSCETMSGESVAYSTENLTFPETRLPPDDKCVTVYIEVEHDIFQDKQENTTNYITGLFNQSAAIYASDNITLIISEIFIWDTSHAYEGDCAIETLESFQAYRTLHPFEGDIGHLVSYDLAGIAAGFDALCNPDIAERMCFSGIYYPYFNDVPLYSWSVYVFSHEMGHLLGSKHTHACVWNGNNTAIDGCGPCQEEPNPPPHPGGCVNSSIDCYFCSPPPFPQNGGTIMSYCHVRDEVKINFNEGFHPQPRSVILNNITNATCLSDCCPVDITHIGTIYSGEHEASNSIVSIATIDSEQDVIYDAGNFICLESTFLADASNGSTFLAVIDGCGGMYRIAQEENITDNTKENSVSIKNYPNPFTGVTTIEFTLREDSPITLSISDVTGRQIAILLTGKQYPIGTHQITFNGNSHPAGMYYYTIQAGDYIGAQKMTLIKQ